MHQTRIIILVSLSLIAMSGCVTNTKNTNGPESKKVQYKAMKVENAPQEVIKEKSALKIDIKKKELDKYESKSDFEKHMEQIDKRRR